MKNTRKKLIIILAGVLLFLVTIVFAQELPDKSNSVENTEEASYQYIISRSADDFVDRSNRGLQRVDVPLIGRQRLFPVPLIDIDRMDAIERLIRADCIHVSV